MFEVTPDGDSCVSKNQRLPSCLDRRITSKIELRTDLFKSSSWPVCHNLKHETLNFKLSSPRHIEDRPCHIRRFVRQQPKNHVRHFFRLASSFKRNMSFFQTFYAARIPTFSMKVSINYSRTNGVNADTFIGNFLCQSDGHRIDSPF